MPLPTAAMPCLYPPPPAHRHTRRGVPRPGRPARARPPAARGAAPLLWRAGRLLFRLLALLHTLAAGARAAGRGRVLAVRGAAAAVLHDRALLLRRPRRLVRHLPRDVEAARGDASPLLGHGRVRRDGGGATGLQGPLRAGLLHAHRPLGRRERRRPARPRRHAPAAHHAQERHPAAAHARGDVARDAPRDGLRLRAHHAHHLLRARARGEPRDRPLPGGRAQRRRHLRAQLALPHDGAPAQ
mmetsp:Transcript_18775/g.48371  ORF Transcript_18775/g.48371 Transcript_18775/m.48371 type:complete len:242 (+) Transcript_18775:2-727(+)